MHGNANSQSMVITGGVTLLSKFSSYVSPITRFGNALLTICRCMCAASRVSAGWQASKPFEVEFSLPLFVLVTGGADPLIKAAWVCLPHRCGVFTDYSGYHAGCAAISQSRMRPGQLCCYVVCLLDRDHILEYVSVASFGCRYNFLARSRLCIRSLP